MSNVMFRSIRPEVFCKKYALYSHAEKHLRQSLFDIKETSLETFRTRSLAWLLIKNFYILLLLIDHID